MATSMTESHGDGIQQPYKSKATQEMSRKSCKLDDKGVYFSKMKDHFHFVPSFIYKPTTRGGKQFIKCKALKNH